MEAVNDNLQIEGVDYDNDTIIAEPEMTHTDDGDLFVPVLEAHTQSGKVLSTVANLHVEQDGLQQALIGVVMTQYHEQKGLKVFGEAGADGVRKELQQLHNHKIPKLVHPEGLSKEQFTKVLEYLMFLKEKQSGVIKGWGCTDG